MTKYGRSPWVDLFPTSRVPAYADQRGPIETAVAIIGGGLTGCATAYAFAAAGVDVVLVDAGRLGRGGTGASTGWIAEEPGVSFVDVERAVGLRAARHVFRSWRRAALDFSALLRRLDVKCHLEARGAATVALTPEQVSRLKREHRERVQAGLEAPMLNARGARKETALDAGAAIRVKDGAVLDPYRACLGLAAAAIERGAAIFERSPVKRVTFTRKSATVMTTAGSIRARRVVVATGTPGALFKSLVRHVWDRTSFQALTDPLPAKVRHATGLRDLVIRGMASPAHVVRRVGEDRVLVAGADGDVVAPRLREGVLVQRTGQLMYELSTFYPDISGTRPAYGWSSTYGQTVDGIPYIGPHRNFPHHLFAFGGSGRSVTVAYLASRILLRHHLEEPDSADSAFEFTRYGR
jgi:glycine/D-amino acid oxidase-like deaminating enzyme